MGKCTSRHQFWYGGLKQRLPGARRLLKWGIFRHFIALLFGAKYIKFTKTAAKYSTTVLLSVVDNYNSKQGGELGAH